MNEPKGRREFIQLLGFGGVVFASGLSGACTNILRKPYQLPELRQAVAEVIARRAEQAHDPQRVGRREAKRASR